MGYIKFRLRLRKTDSVGNTTRASICRIESDMTGTSVLETNLILHALAAPGGKVVVVSGFVLNAGILNNENDILE